jgi:phage tail-like protein
MNGFHFRTATVPSVSLGRSRPSPQGGFIASLVGLLLALASLAASAAPPGTATAVLLLDGKEVARFREISGVQAAIEVIPMAGSGDGVARKRPGRAKYGNIVMKRGLVSDHALLEWYDKALNGTVERKSGSIIYLDREGNEVLRVNLFECWPVAYRIGAIPDEQGESAVESFELACSGIQRAASPPGRNRRPAEFALPRGVTVWVDDKPALGVVAVSEAGMRIDIDDAGRSLVSAENITLTLDRSADPALHDWFRDLSVGKDIRKSITVNVRLDRNSKGRRYTMLEAWPCQWNAPELNSNGDTYIVEELEFAVERVERG